VNPLIFLYDSLTRARSNREIYRHLAAVSDPQIPRCQCWLQVDDVGK